MDIIKVLWVDFFESLQELKWKQILATLIPISIVSSCIFLMTILWGIGYLASVLIEFIIERMEGK